MKAPSKSALRAHVGVPSQLFARGAPGFPIHQLKSLKKSNSNPPRLLGRRLRLCRAGHILSAREVPCEIGCCNDPKSEAVKNFWWVQYGKSDLFQPRS